MSLDPTLLSILACPEDKGPLHYLPDDQVLFNPRLRRTYPVRDGIPVMLIEESTTVSDAEFERLTTAVADGAIPPTFGD